MKTLYLVRHCSTPWNKHGFLSFTDLPLSEKGIEEARQVAEVLRNKKIEKIYSSPLKRALETAKIISQLIGRPLEVREELREINFGIFEGLSLEEAKKKYPRIFEKRKREKWSFRIPGGESYEDGLKRVKPLLSEVISKGEKAVLVTHATLIKVILKYLCGLSLENIEKNYISPGSVIEVSKRNKRWEFKLLRLQQTLLS